MGTISGHPVFAQDLFEPIDEKLKRLAETTASAEEFRRAAAAMVSNELSNLEGKIVFQAAAEAAMGEGEKQMLEKLLLTRKNDLLAEYGGSATRAEKMLQRAGVEHCQVHGGGAHQVGYEFLLSEVHHAADFGDPEHGIGPV